MRRLLTALCLGFVFTLGGWASASAQIWSEYAPEGGRYRILMPGTPQVSTEPVSLPDGSKVQMLQAIIETPDAAYLSTHVDYPPEMVRRTTSETLLDNVRNGSSRGHTLVREKRLTIAGNPGREYVITRANGITLATRSFIVGNRLYQVIVAGRAGVDQNPDTRQFLESFTLLQ